MSTVDGGGYIDTAADLRGAKTLLDHGWLTTAEYLSIKGAIAEAALSGEDAEIAEALEASSHSAPRHFRSTPSAGTVGGGGGGGAGKPSRGPQRCSICHLLRKDHECSGVTCTNPAVCGQDRLHRDDMLRSDRSRSRSRSRSQTARRSGRAAGSEEPMDSDGDDGDEDFCESGGRASRIARARSATGGRSSTGAGAEDLLLPPPTMVAGAVQGHPHVAPRSMRQPTPMGGWAAPERVSPVLGQTRPIGAVEHRRGPSPMFGAAAAARPPPPSQAAATPLQPWSDSRFAVPLSSTGCPRSPNPFASPFRSTAAKLDSLASPVGGCAPDMDSAMLDGLVSLASSASAVAAAISGSGPEPAALPTALEEDPDAAARAVEVELSTIVHLFARKVRGGCPGRLNHVAVTITGGVVEAASLFFTLSTGASVSAFQVEIVGSTEAAVFNAGLMRDYREWVLLVRKKYGP